MPILLAVDEELMDCSTWNNFARWIAMDRPMAILL
jgi:hypothetical protein